MNQSKIISLPFWETIKRSFLYPIVNIGVVMKIIGIWFLLLIYEVANGYPTICKLTEEGCNGISQNIAMLLLSFASISIAVAFSRNVILKTQYDKITFSFGKKEWKYLGYNILIILIVAVPSLLLVILASYLASVIHVNIINYVFIIPLLVTIVCSRFYLVLPATAVGNKSMDMKSSFALTKGNANKIFWGQILLMIPIAIVLLVISAIFAAIGSDSFIIKFIFVAMVMFLSFFDTCVKASFYSHIYQYFLFFQDKGEEVANIAPVKEVAKVEVVAKPKKTVTPKKTVAKKEATPKKAVAPKKKPATTVKKKTVAKK